MTRKEQLEKLVNKAKEDVKFYKEFIAEKEMVLTALENELKELEANE